MKPQIFGKYCLLDRISVGGMAEVFRARPFNDRGYTGFLALKRILPHLAEDQEFIKMFIDEAALTTRLHHKNIVRVHELATYKDSNFILMEYICGRDILAVQKAMRRRREICPVDFAAMVMSDVAHGLDFAHKATDDAGRSLNIVHRDVSPQNILIQYDGIAKVIDFGIAKARVKSTKTRVGVVKGKVGYMSPEQVRSEPLNGQSDIFSVGVVFWELVTNKRLFKGANEFDTMHMVREAEVRAPSMINPAVPAELDRIILKALAADLNERYQSGAEMAADLDQWLKFQPTSRTRFARWMQAIFESDVEEERERIERFKGIQNPNDVIEYNRLIQSKETQQKKIPTGMVEDTAADQLVFHEDKEEQPGHEPVAQEVAAVEPITTATPEPTVETIQEEVLEKKIDAAAYMAFAEEQTQIRAGGFSFDDLDNPSSQEEQDNPFAASFGFGASSSEAALPEAASKGSAFDSPSSPPRAFDAPSSSTQYQPPQPILGYKILGIGFLSLLLTGIGAAVAAAMLLGPGENQVSGNVGYASIVLNVIPPQGIVVNLDNERRGNVSPVTVDAVKPGKHQLVVRAKGYNTYTEALNVPKSGIVEKTITLTPKKEELSTLRVDVGKLGSSAVIYLDGEPTSTLAASEGIQLLPGEHVLEITENGKSSYSNLLTLVPSETTTVTPKLVSYERRIQFPEGYSVEINGKPIRGNSAVVDTRIPQLITLKNGATIMWDGYVGYPDIAVMPFDVEHTPQNLVKDDFGWLAIDTKDDWWVISIDSVNTGLSSPISVDDPIPVRKGLHTLRLERAGAQTEIPFEAEPGGTVVFDRKIALNTSYSETGD